MFLSLLLCLFIEISAQPKVCRPPKGGNNNHLPPPPHHQDPLDDTSTSGGISADPNEIIGPTGYDDSLRWVSINDVLNYTIFFENDPDFATANAQKVDVRFNFADKAAMKGFGLGTYGFANQSWNIEDAPAAYQNRLDLRDSMHIYVDLTAGIDVVKQQAFWLFNSIDPETGYNPWQVDRGMLPVNDSTHVGEGFVTFRLKPQENLKTGDTISIVASIVFDQNDTIPTNRWRNTIDAGNPTSKVKARQDSKNEHLYHLTLQAADDEGGSGLKHVLLYQANNFGIYEEVATCPVDTVIDFTAEPGHQYRFYSIAEDNVGNREPLKEQPDLVININAAPTDIALSDSIFQDDIAAGGFIAEMTSEDVEEGNFTYALAEGDGAIHNDLFQITGSQLQAKECFKCAEDSVYKIRLSTTDEGGMTFSKAFELNLRKVLDKPENDTIVVNLCEGESFLFKGVEYKKTGTFYHTIGNEFMCDSVYVLQVAVNKRLEAPIVTIKEGRTLVSSAAKGNQWFLKDGTPIEGATEQEFTPDEEGIYYVAATNGSCFSEPSKLYRVRTDNNIELALNLAEGWNWVSVNLDSEGEMETLDFLEPITEVADEFKSLTQGMVKDQVLDWFGNLKKILPESGYKLHLKQDVSHTWQGKARDTDKAPVTLYKGWNWIGYVPVSETTIDVALSNLQATEGDYIKGFDDFSVYNNGKWVGTLTMMKPGEGYMYQAKQANAFTYPASHIFLVEEEVSQARTMTSSGTPWTVVKHAYPDNMTLIGQVYADGMPAPEGLYTIGAFAGEECRGIGKYVGGTLFMTIHGDVASKERISFKAFANAAGRVFDIHESCLFENTMQGNMDAPMALHIKGETGIENIGGTEYTIYPNPVRQRLFINGDTEAIKAVTIIATSGTKVMNVQGYTPSGIDASRLTEGTYVVVLTTESGDHTYKFIKVAK